MISLVECRRVLLDGPTFQNSPAWNIHPLLSEDIVIRNITVLNPWYSQNGDGLDLDSCRRAIVYNCRFDVGDDAICIKSGKDEYGRKRGRPTEDVVIIDNIVYHGHGGFTVGSEMSGGVRNILVERCTFLGTDVGLRFKTTRGRGGVVEKIWIRDVQMKDIPTDAIGFNMYYGGEAPTDVAETAEVAPRPAMPVNEGTPQFRDIVLTRILCRGAGRAVMLEGLPEMPIRGIVLEDVRISANQGLATVDADTITLRRVEIAPQAGPGARRPPQPECHHRGRRCGARHRRLPARRRRGRQRHPRVWRRFEEREDAGRNRRQRARWRGRAEVGTDSAVHPHWPTGLRMNDRTMADTKNTMNVTAAVSSAIRRAL